MNAGSPELKELLRFARELAVKAGALTLEHFGGVLASDTKGDGTPVTVADRGAETLLREEIASRFPEHGILGEEFGVTNPDAHVRWILDPIDGTKAFVRGVPIYGVLIGIFVGEDPTVGVAHFPALRETVSAALGCGCEWNGTPARVSQVANLGQALTLTTDLAEIRNHSLSGAWEELIRRTGLSRTWGDCWGHALVATGRAEIMIDPILAPWDSAPFLPILTEAGGRYSDLSGNEPGDGLSALSTNGLLHDQVLEILQAK